MATDVNGVRVGTAPAGIAHFKVPFTIGPTGAAATVQQGTITEVTQSVANLVGTRPGTRLVVPRYGIPDPTFSGITTTALRFALGQYEKRATVVVDSVPGNQQAVPVLVSLAQGGSA